MAGSRPPDLPTAGRERRGLPLNTGQVSAAVRAGGTFPDSAGGSLSPSEALSQANPCFSAALGENAQRKGLEAGCQGGQVLRHLHFTLGLAPGFSCRHECALSESASLTFLRVSGCGEGGPGK